MKAKKTLSKRQIEKTHGNIGDPDESIVVYCEDCHTELDKDELKHGKLCFICGERYKEYLNWLDNMAMDEIEKGQA